MKKYLSFILFISFLFLNACKEKNTQPPPTITSANASGEVNLFDEGMISLNDSGMTVIIADSDPIISVVTDDEGVFIFEDLEYGTYTLEYEKENYGTYKIFDLLHKEGASFLSTVPALGQKSSTEVLSVSQSQFEQSILIDVECSPPANTTNTNYLRYFLTLSPNVSSSLFSSFSQTLSCEIDPCVITLTQSQLNNLGFDSGTTVYIRVYGESFWSNNYQDPDDGHIFPNLNPTTADAISFIVP